jgi:TPR repeat protein
MGVQKDAKEAAWYLKLAGDQNDSRGQAHYSVCLRMCREVTANLREAGKYCQLSADQNDPHGQTRHSFRCFHGLGIMIDPIEAARYSKL